MNPLTLVKRIQKLNSREADLGISEDASWHAKYRDSAYVFVGGIPYDLTEGDLLAIFAQCGEVVDVNLVRDKASGKSKGFAFIAYEDQRSTNLAVDNLNAAQILGRTIRVDHVSKYKKKEEEDEETERQMREERGVCRAFQRGECTRGAGCKFSHDEQRAANTGWGHEEDKRSKWGHDKFQGGGKLKKPVDIPSGHDREPGAANTGWGHEEDRRSKWGHDKFQGGGKLEKKPVDILSGHDREPGASVRRKADDLDAGRSRRRDDESFRKADEVDGGRSGRRDDESYRKADELDAGRSRRRDDKSYRKADELDAGRSRRRDDESYRKHSESDYKDRDGRDRSRQLEVKEKVAHKEERDTRGAYKSSTRGAGEDYERREEKRPRHQNTEEYLPRENRDERKRERGKDRDRQREERSPRAKDSSTLRDDHHISQR